MTGNGLKWLKMAENGWNRQWIGPCQPQNITAVSSQQKYVFRCYTQFVGVIYDTLHRLVSIKQNYLFPGLSFNDVQKFYFMWKDLLTGSSLVTFLCVSQVSSSMNLKHTQFIYLYLYSIVKRVHVILLNVYLALHSVQCTGSS